jgi:hypothetical protein
MSAGGAGTAKLLPKSPKLPKIAGIGKAKPFTAKGAEDAKEDETYH